MKNKPMFRPFSPPICLDQIFSACSLLPLTLDLLLYILTAQTLLQQEFFPVDLAFKLSLENNTLSHNREHRECIFMQISWKPDRTCERNFRKCPVKYSIPVGLTNDEKHKKVKALFWSFYTSLTCIFGKCSCASTCVWLLFSLFSGSNLHFILSHKQIVCCSTTQRYWS